jgi:hypothetical protein
MKKTAMVLAGLGMVFVPLAHGQIPFSVSNVVAAAAVATQSDPLPPSEVPPAGMFYSAQNLNLPPAPGNFNQLSAWYLGNGCYLLDDLDGDVQAQSLAGNRTKDDGPPSPGDGGGGSGSGGDGSTNNYSYSFPTNGLWMQAIGLGLTNNIVYLNLNNATDFVYEVFSTTSLSMTNNPLDWNIEQEVFPVTNQNPTPFTVLMGDRTNSLFFWARDWTGIASPGNTTPQWWFYYWFGSISLSDTNLDSSGEATLSDDYRYFVDPNIIYFSINVTNQFFNTSAATVQTVVSGGVPFYMATLVDSSDTNSASWTAYNSNLVVNLGSTPGWHAVLVGLKGLPANATQTWLPTQIKLVLTPPVLTATNPAPGVVTQPFIQVQGYCFGTSLASLSYDLNNSAGLETNQQALVTSSLFGTNNFEYTNTAFQCFNVPMAVGTNIVTLHAADLAGNVTSTNLAYIYDPTANTNPPSFIVSWPPNGASISGTNFPVRGTINDPFASVAAQIVNNGETNGVAGLVEQNGSFWIENVPLGAGTNYLTITATNAAGYGTVATLIVTQSSVLLTISSVTFNDPAAPSATVTGALSGSGTVLVNGVAATNNGDGTWTASYVPVGDSGTAALTADATADGLASPMDALVAEDVIRSSEVLFAEYQENAVFVNSKLTNSEIEFNTYEYGSAGNYYDYFYAPDSFIYFQGNWNANGYGTYDQGSSTNWGDTGSPLAVWTGLVPAIPPPGWNFNATVSIPGYSEQFKTQSLYTLKTRGQGLPGQNNLWAVTLYNVETLTPLDEFADSDNGTWVSASEFTVAGQTPDATGSIYLSAPNDTSINLPVSGPAPSFAFNVGGGQVPLHIYFGGQDVAGRNTTVIVGQQISLTSGFGPGAPPITHYIWSIPGTAISNFYVSPDSSHTNGYPIPFTGTNNVEADFYWADAGTKALNCTVQCGGVTYTQAATFNVVRPSVSVTTTTGTVTVGTGPNGRLGLLIGNLLGTPGIRFSNAITMPTLSSTNYYNSGNTNYSIQWVQLLTSSTAIVTVSNSATNIVSHSIEQNGTVLDVFYPYPPESETTTADSPWVELGGPGEISATRGVNAEMWLMFEPQNGSWVPLWRISWTGSGTATGYGNTWSLSGTNIGMSVSLDAGGSYPM